MQNNAIKSLSHCCKGDGKVRRKVDLYIVVLKTPEVIWYLSLVHDYRKSMNKV